METNAYDETSKHLWCLIVFLHICSCQFLLEVAMDWPIFSQRTLSLPPKTIRCFWVYKASGFLMFSGGRERVHWEQMGQNILKDWLQLINENDYHTKITIWTNLLYIHAILIKSIGPFLSVFPEEGVVRGKTREIKVISYSQPKHNTKETYSSRKPFEQHFFTTLGHSGTLTLRILFRLLRTWVIL